MLEPDQAGTGRGSGERYHLLRKDTTMQATVNQPIHHISRTKLILAAVVLLGLTITATAAMALNGGAANTNTPSAHTSVTERSPSWRFAEINALPEGTSQAQTNWRLLEINVLPDAPVADTVSYEQIRFVEINELPGDTELIAPEMGHGTRS
jgi:hypothetical protein